MKKNYVNLMKLENINLEIYKILKINPYVHF